MKAKLNNDLYHYNSIEFNLEKYKKTTLLKAANKQLNFSILRKIFTVFYSFFETLCDSDTIRSYCVSEYICRFSLSGAFYYKAINSIIIDLKKADSILHSDSIKELIKALSYAQKIEKSLFFLKNKKKLIRKLKEDFRSLEINKSLAIPISASQHAMILLITCIGKNENGKKIYQATHYNTGLGIKNHHYSQYNDQQLIFQIGLEITAITEEKLCGKNS